jgi:hypothetical protein
MHNLKHIFSNAPENVWIVFRTSPDRFSGELTAAIVGVRVYGACQSQSSTVLILGNGS